MKTLRNLGYFNLLVGFPLFYYSFSLWFLGLIPAGLVFLGLAWAYRHRPFLGAGGQAALGLLPVVATALALAGAATRAARPYRQTVLVPAGYRGLVVIGYGVAQGQPEAWDEDSRLIRVSRQGTAATRFALADQGTIAPENDRFYAVSATGGRQALPTFKAFLTPPPAPTAVGVYHTYLNGGPNVLVSVVARADSMTQYLDTATFTLRPAYSRQARAMAGRLGVGTRLPAGAAAR